MINNKIISEINKTKKGISVEKYIHYCLFDRLGYYNNIDPIGKKGDFVTSPEISQLFGDILGLYVYKFWEKNFKNNFNLIELGPGKGSLILDILRVTKSYTKFQEKINIYLIETSETLIKKQKQNILSKKLDYFNIKWDTNIFNIKKNNSIIIANEFFDCFPVRHFVKKNTKWIEKVINYNNEEKKFFYQYDEIGDAKILKNLSNYDDNDIAEVSTKRENYFKSICEYISQTCSLCIIIDYGYLNFPGYFTLQGISNHKYSNILDNVGKQDISSLVNFKNFINIARDYNFKISYCNQKEFLERYGIFERKEKIKTNLSKEKIKNIEIEYDRLINKNNTGSEFKFLIISKT